MTAAALPDNEAARLERLRAYGILDTPPEEAFQRIVRLAAAILDVPIALISLVDEHRQWFKARVGLGASETPRELAFCAHAIHGTDVYVVPDATQDPLFKDNALVTGPPDIRFYAGAPLVSREGFRIGTVCAIDRRPREITPVQLACLKDLSALAIEQMELRAAGRAALRDVAERARLDAFQSAFVATVNHELRTPLTSVIGALDLVNSGAVGEVPADIANLLEIADRNAGTLLRLINDLLDSAKFAEGKLDLALETADLAELVAECADNIKSYCAERGVTVVLGRRDGADVRIDKVRIGQVMNNLLSNAVKFSAPRSEVRVDVVRNGSFAEVSVTDKGGGIPESIRPRIFEKFVQAKPTVSAHPGTGLGLSIAKGIVELHQGDIGFEVEDGVGTRFFFRLPVAQGS